MKKNIIMIMMLLIPSLGQACNLDSFVNGVERNTNGCNRELSSYGSPKPGGQCVSLIASAELLGDYLSRAAIECSSSQNSRAKKAISLAISTLQHAQNR